MTIITGYQDWMVERNHSPNSQRQRIKFATRLLSEWGTFEVTGHHAARWLNQFEGWTFHTYMTDMKSVYEFLIDAGYVEVSPIAKLRRPPVPPPMPRPLLPAQRDRVLSSFDGDQDLRAWCMLAYFAGLRVHEIAKLRGEHVNDNFIYVLGKGAKAADIPTHEALWALASEFPRVGYWFPSRRGVHLNADSITSRVTPYFRSLGIEKGSVHRLRHTFAQDMSDNGTHPRTIQELMRHSSLEVTMRYLEAGDARKRVAVSGLTMPVAA